MRRLSPHVMEVVCRLGLKMMCADIGRTSAGEVDLIRADAANLAGRCVRCCQDHLNPPAVYRCWQQRIAAVIFVHCGSHVPRKI